MATERTPEEARRDSEDKARVAAVIDRAVADLAAWRCADELDEPPAVCEQWVDAIWDGLRDNLSSEDRLLAIIQLIQPKADATAYRLLNLLRGA